MLVGSRVVDEEQMQVTAPVLPWELALRSAGWFFQKYPDGRIALKFIPTTQSPQGPALMPPAVEVIFDEDGWRRFQEDVAASENIPRPHIATVMPPGIRNGGV